MKEFLLWTLGLQKLASSESALFNGIQNKEISGSDPTAVLNQIINSVSPEQAEGLALASGGLRTVRALWFCCDTLKNLKDGEKIRELANFEYPYDYLVKRGKELDAMLQPLVAADLEEDDELEDELEDEDILDEEEEDLEDDEDED